MIGGTLEGPGSDGITWQIAGTNGSSFPLCTGEAAAIERGYVLHRVDLESPCARCARRALRRGSRVSASSAWQAWPRCPEFWDGPGGHHQ
jgi:hypothetical protein